jgi:hypothetical protein
MFGKLTVHSEANFLENFEKLEMIQDVIHEIACAISLIFSHLDVKLVEFSFVSPKSVEEVHRRLYKSLAKLYKI